MKYDLSIVIGRFRPFHLGHKTIVDQALEIGTKTVILIGSANAARSARNPFAHEEVVEMISRVYPEQIASGRIIFLPISDFTYDEGRWLEHVEETVRSILDQMPGNSPGVTNHGWADYKVTLVGNESDHSSYYLKLFPNWIYSHVDVSHTVHATEIRDGMFSSDSLAPGHMPNEVSQWLMNWMGTDHYKIMRHEHSAIRYYKESWARAPYPPTFNAADAIVQWRQKVLLVRRKVAPGIGLLAIPGGFINQHELPYDAAIRELHEETGLDLMQAEAMLVHKRLFDHPNRSQRGRVFSHAFVFRINTHRDISIQAGDDAAEAMWVSPSQIDPREMFDDHYHILSAFGVINV